MQVHPDILEILSQLLIFVYPAQHNLSSLKEDHCIFFIFELVEIFLVISLSVFHGLRDLFFIPSREHPMIKLKNGHQNSGPNRKKWKKRVYAADPSQKY